MKTDQTNKRGAALDLVLRFARFGPAYIRWVNRHLPSDGTSASRLRLLGALYEKGSMSMRSLTQELSVSAQNISVMVEGLEGQKLVFRKDDPADRRVVLVDLTPEGRELVAAGMQAHHEAVAALFTCLSDEEQRLLADCLDRLIIELGA